MEGSWSLNTILFQLFQIWNKRLTLNNYQISNRGKENTTKSLRRAWGHETLEIKKGGKKVKTQSQACLDQAKSKKIWKHDLGAL